MVIFLGPPEKGGAYYGDGDDEVSCLLPPVNFDGEEGGGVIKVLDLSVPDLFLF